MKTLSTLDEDIIILVLIGTDSGQEKIKNVKLSPVYLVKLTTMKLVPKSTS